MRIVIDSNIVFSAILNSNSKISQIILKPKTKFNFYSTSQLLIEINKHKAKIQKITKYSDHELDRIIAIITNKIRFINVQLIPKEIYLKAEELLKDIDIDDTEFIALTEHSKAKLWTGDKDLIKGLKEKNWDKFITTGELYDLVKVK